jgi:hypothetical protein
MTLSASSPVWGKVEVFLHFNLILLSLPHLVLHPLHLSSFGEVVPRFKLVLSAPLLPPYAISPPSAVCPPSRRWITTTTMALQGKTTVPIARRGMWSISRFHATSARRTIRGSII